MTSTDSAQFSGVLAAMLLAAIAAALAIRPDPGRRLGNVSYAEASKRAWGRRRLIGVSAVGGSLACIAILGPSRGLLGAAGACVAGVLAELLAAQQVARRAARRRAAVARAARVLAGQLRIGQVPTTALRSAAEDCPPLERAAATIAIGGDVAAALRAVATDPGHEGLNDVSMAWELSERSGAPIADLMSQVSAGLREREETGRTVAAELAGPRASGRLLACLPLIGLGMGKLSGGDPVHFLFGTLPGHACILAGVLLAGSGVLWTEQLADKAQR